MHWTVYMLFMLLCKCCYVFADLVLTELSGTVGAENYTYYSLREDGDVTIILTSQSGDCDLYISESNSKPTFSNYDISSATCGVDLATVPSEFKRPTYIGVYGHVHAPISTYTLTAVLNYTGNLNYQE